MDDEKRLLIAVGSKNPVKVGAVRTVMQRVAADKLLNGLVTFEVQGIEVPSGVSEQPMDDEETIRGAFGRAQATLAAIPAADWGVGLEGGVVRLNGELFTCAWCALVDRRGNRALGGGLRMPLPPPIATDIANGIELGIATDRLFKTENSKQAGGALGYLSKGLHSRQQAYEGIFIYALSKFLNPSLYELK